MAFADALKDEACQILNLNRSDLELRKQELRFFLEALGAAHRLIDPEHWIKKVRAQWENMHGGLAKITDVRHFNEAEWVNRAGGIVIFLHRAGVEPASLHEATNLDSMRNLPYVKHVANDEPPEHAAQTILDLIKAEIAAKAV